MGTALPIDTSAGRAEPLLLSAPIGLLTIGKTEYRFTEGCFRPDQTQSTRPKQAKGSPASALPARRRALVRVLEWGLAALVGLMAGLGLAAWIAVGGWDSPMERAGTARHRLRRRTA